MRDQGKTEFKKRNTEFKKLGLSAAAIGIGEEGEEDEKKSAKLFSVVRSPG